MNTCNLNRSSLQLDFRQRRFLNSEDRQTDDLGGVVRMELIFNWFEFFPTASLFIKDLQGKYLKANQSMAESFGLLSPVQILNKSDFDFLPYSLAKRYATEEQRVIAGRAPLVQQRCYLPGSDGLPVWYQISKIPLFDSAEQVVGLAGLKVPCETDCGEIALPNRRMARILKFIAQHFRDPVTVGDLAAEAGCSVSQLQREFRKELGVNPARYLQDIRVGYSRHLLKTTRLTMVAIANECGFYDQSHFSRIFKSATGISPASYRTKFTVSS
jgi:AraC-like DNA-binding protein